MEKKFAHIPSPLSISPSPPPRFSFSVLSFYPSLPFPLSYLLFWHLSHHRPLPPSSSVRPFPISFPLLLTTPLPLFPFPSYIHPNHNSFPFYSSSSSSSIKSNPFFSPLIFLPFSFLPLPLSYIPFDFFLPFFTSPSCFLLLLHLLPLPINSPLSLSYIFIPSVVYPSLSPFPTIPLPLLPHQRLWQHLLKEQNFISIGNLKDFYEMSGAAAQSGLWRHGRGGSTQRWRTPGT